MLRFKFQQNRKMNKEFDFWEVKAPPTPEGGRDSRFQKFKNVPYKTMVLTDTENFSPLAQLEKV